MGCGKNMCKFFPRLCYSLTTPVTPHHADRTSLFRLAIPRTCAGLATRSSAPGQADAGARHHLHLCV